MPFLQGGMTMPIHFNVDDVMSERIDEGVRRQRLLNSQKVRDIKFQLDRFDLDGGATFDLNVAPRDLAWFQVLSGELTLSGPRGQQRLGQTHVVFLPPSFTGALETKEGATFLLAVVPDAAQLDPEFAAKPPGFRTVDWKDEPLLESKHDARKRIYLVTQALFGTKAIKGEMIIYPPQTAAPEHYHIGAAHFMYFLKGGGTAFANGQPLPVKSGDVVYYFDQEPHALRSGAQNEMVFSEFFVPGVFKTVWIRPEVACTWVPTGTNIAGGKPSREIKEHSFANPLAPTDV
jgi:quercetin dioxygenase-like cupin family protein